METITFRVSLVQIMSIEAALLISYLLDSGNYHSSTQELCNATGLTPKQLQGALNKLISSQIITVSRTKMYGKRLISIIDNSLSNGLISSNKDNKKTPNKPREKKLLPDEISNSRLHSQFNNIYFSWYKEEFKLDYQTNGKDQKALKELREKMINQMVKVANDKLPEGSEPFTKEQLSDESILNSWEMFLKMLPAFYRTKSLSTINLHYSAIVAQIRTNYVNNKSRDSGAQSSGRVAKKSNSDKVRDAINSR